MKKNKPMKFTTPCFIRKDTPELRQKLEKFGYKIEHLQITKCVTYECAYYYDDNGYATTRGGAAYLTNVDGMRPTYIDCGTNEALFLALAAMRSDSDEGQWFVFTELFFTDCHVFHTGDIIHYDEVKKMFTVFEQPMYVRKATPAELISHFTEKGGGE